MQNKRVRKENRNATQKNQSQENKVVPKSLTHITSEPTRKNDLLSSALSIGNQAAKVKTTMLVSMSDFMLFLFRTKLNIKWDMINALCISY